MDDIRAKFIEEATDLIADLEEALLAMENDTQDETIIERIFRVMHTLKGSSAMFGFEKMGEFTHHLENIYELIRDGKMAVSVEIVNITLTSVDQLKLLLNNNDTLNAVDKMAYDHCLQEIVAIAKNVSNPDQAEVSVKEELSEQIKTYYIIFRPDTKILTNGTNPLYLLDDLYALGNCKVTPHCNNIPTLDTLQVEDCYVYWDVYLVTKESEQVIKDVFMFVEDECLLEIHKISDSDLLKHKGFLEKIDEEHQAGHVLNVEELREIIHNLLQIVKKGKAHNEEKSSKGKDSILPSIRVATDKLDNLMNLVSELITSQARLSLFAEREGNAQLVSIAEDMEKISRQLRDNAFSICLIPIEHIFTRFQRMIRDVSQELNKQVDFITEGGDTEMDKTIIDSLADPLMHMLRNSLDHGIETAEERIKKGKPAKGKITLSAYYSGAHVHIQVKDDGAGIDVEKVRKKAIAKGIIAADKVLKEHEIQDLIFAPGFSTAEKVTGISGRGVGMDVVRQKVAELRGEIDLESTLGAGTILTVKLPLTLSIMDGLLVEIAQTRYIIPLAVVDRCCETRAHKLRSFSELFGFEGEQLSYIDLRSNFKQHEASEEHNPEAIIFIVLVRYEHLRVGLVVDHILGEYQAVLKPIGKLYKDQKFLSGASILGDGTIALVLDIQKTIQYFNHSKINQIPV